jgi:hypothetical protein
MQPVVIILQKILKGNFIAGYQTHVTAYEENLGIGIPGMQRQIWNCNHKIISNKKNNLFH